MFSSEHQARLTKYLSRPHTSDYDIQIMRTRTTIVILKKTIIRIIIMTKLVRASSKVE